MASLRFARTPLRASSFGLGPAKRGIPSVKGEGGAPRERQEAIKRTRYRKVLRLLADRRLSRRHGRRAGFSCRETGEECVDGLVLCKGHALEAKLEGQISCWGEMLFHVDLWSREASRRDRPDVVRLLEDQRVRATSAMQRARADLDVGRRESPRATWRSAAGVLRRGPPPLPPGGAQRLFRGLLRR